MDKDSNKSNPPTQDGVQKSRVDSGKITTPGGLVVEPEPDQDADRFSTELARTLNETKQAVLSIKGGASEKEQALEWETARVCVEKFRPVPWFIWRLSNYVLGKPGRTPEVPEGLVLGLRRLLFAAASDATLGTGQKENAMKRALEVLKPDVVAAVAVIHAICRRFQGKPHDRIWRPILEDAVLRARLGFDVGAHNPDFGSGRGMLAGFMGRSGLAVLIAGGELEDAQKALEMLASGQGIKNVGLKIYGTDPLQVSAMMLSGAACGRDAAFGIVAYASKDAQIKLENEDQFRWLSAFAITESVRTGKLNDTDARYWNEMGFIDSEGRQKLIDSAKTIVREGHEWSWIL